MNESERELFKTFNNLKIESVARKIHMIECPSQNLKSRVWSAKPRQMDNQKNTLLYVISIVTIMFTEIIITNRKNHLSLVGEKAVFMNYLS